MLYTDTLRTDRDFRLCYHKGQCIVSKDVIIYARRNKLGIDRLGITTGKKVGNAVARSRCRRLIRQAWRENEAAAPVGLDIVIVARAHLKEVSSDVLSRYLQKYGIPALHRVCAGEALAKPPQRQTAKQE